MEQLTFKVEVFEGPLDLLLHLIAKHKLDIRDIPIAELLEQYLSHIAAMRQHNLELSSDFLAMAARLVHIKTVSLLPGSEEGEELRRELSGELVEYQLCQEAAQRLSERYVGGLQFVRPPQDIPVDRTYRREHLPAELYRAYEMALLRAERRQPPRAAEFSPLVERRIVSVTAKILMVMRRLILRGKVALCALFAGEADRPERVATFLAVLELVKAGRVGVSDDGAELALIRRGQASRPRAVSAK